MQKQFVLASFAVAIAIGAIAMAPGTPPALAARAPMQALRYTTENTDIGTLLNDPEAKAVLIRHLPELVKSEQIDMARAMTLRAIQQYSRETITDAKLEAIDADLARLPPKM